MRSGLKKSIFFELCPIIYLSLKVIETTLAFSNIAKLFFSDRKSPQRSNANFEQHRISKMAQISELRTKHINIVFFNGFFTSNLFLFDTYFDATAMTDHGRYRWTRLPFGLSASSEIFQKRLHQALEGLLGVACIADDILVYGAGDTLEEATLDHDRES